MTFYPARFDELVADLLPEGITARLEQPSEITLDDGATVKLLDDDLDHMIRLELRFAAIAPIADDRIAEAADPDGFVRDMLSATLAHMLRDLRRRLDEMSVDAR